MKNFIIANWKMNPTSLGEAKALFNSVEEGVGKIDPEAEVGICAPFIYLPDLNGRDLIKIGAQNSFWEEKGPYTGEISPKMIKDLGCEYVILGHSERRRYFRESEEEINRKIKEALEFNLVPILCIGETKREKEEGRTKEVLRKEIKEDLEGVTKENLILAYEPIWAIGSGNPCDPEQASETYDFIRKEFENSPFSDIPILYGGSADSQNITSYLEVNYQGVLVGGASLKPKEFVEMVRITSQED